MIFKIFVVGLVAAAAAEPNRILRNNRQEQRDERSLLNTFPFNQQGADHHNQQGHHGDHGDHGDHGANHGQQAFVDLPARDAAQGRRRGGGGSRGNNRGSSNRNNPPPRQAASGDGPPSFADVAAAQEDRATGQRCIDKVEMVEETQYDEVVQCDHSYDKRCHTTYITNYESQQEEECDENFRKNCFIEYEKIAFDELVEVCRTPLVKDCNVDGPDICRTEYESECWTKQEEHDVEDDVVSCETVYEERCEDETSGYTTNTKCTKWPKEVCNVDKRRVTKFTPITGCTKEPITLCAPAGCGFVQGDQECHEKKQTVVQDQPKEQCTLEPQRTCKHVTKLVPKLEPKEECVDVPKEVCTRSRTNPQKIKKPVIKKWCYIPSAESGLA